MESLKIKCPVCGIILEVTNSKNEAVKRIVCPYCKKTLAITFHDEEKPEQKADMVALPALYYGQMCIALQEGQNQLPLPDTDSIIIRLVRLKDGNYKCLVSTKYENTVRLNNEYLLLDDEVALSDGDLLRFGKTVLSFNKPAETDVIIPDTPLTPKHENNADPQKKSHLWLAVAACIAAMVLIAVLWPKEGVDIIDHPVKTEEAKDSLCQTSGNTENLGDEKKDRGEKDIKVVPTPINYDEKTTYELQQMAKDDVKAQCELGKRLVNRKDSAYIVLGTNYLKLASRNGSSDASRALQNVKSILREAANNGNTHADNLLKVINGEQ
jgi:hypothetical protein